MSLVNKSFKDNITGETVKVTSINENIATVNSGDKISLSRLVDSNYYEEVIDPDSFFSSAGGNLLNNIMDKVKTIKTDGMIDDNTINKSISSVNETQFRPATNDSAIIEVSEEDEREALMRKYNVQSTPKTIDPDDLLNNRKTPPTLNTQGNTNVSVSNSYQQEPVQQIVVEDPIITMFKNVKRTVDFNVDLTVSGKIPRIDFIEMMEDSYNTSIIDFLVDEFTNNLLRDPNQIKKMIKDKIVELVGGGEKKTTKPKTTRKPRATKPKSTVTQKIGTIKEGEEPKKPNSKK